MIRRPLANCPTCGTEFRAKTGRNGKRQRFCKRECIRRDANLPRFMPPPEIRPSDRAVAILRRVTSPIVPDTSTWPLRDDIVGVTRQGDWWCFQLQDRDQPEGVRQGSEPA